MPTYCFICPKCGITAEDFRLPQNASKPLLCINCGTEMRRDFGAEKVNAGNKEYGKPLHSDSLAISPEQVTEHQRLFPDVKIDSQCRPVFENYKQHDNYLKKTGFVKEPQKRRKRKKIRG
jgi:hypothetical protein